MVGIEDGFAESCRASPGWAEEGVRRYVNWGASDSFFNDSV